MEEHKQEIKEQHSVEISINAKGQYSGKTKCYGLTPEEAYKRTLNLIQSLETLIKEKNKLE